MSSIILNAFKKAGEAFAANYRPGQFSAGGKPVACPHCGTDRFAEGKAMLNTAGMTFVGLDSANESVTTLACDQCGLIQWFLKPPRRTDLE
jgi:hypothetical protein